MIRARARTRLPGQTLVDKKVSLFDKYFRQVQSDTQMERTWPTGNSSQYLYLKNGLKSPAQLYIWFPLASEYFSTFWMWMWGYLDYFQSYLSLKLAKWPFMVKSTISLEWGEWRSFFKILVLGSIPHVAHNFEHLTHKNGNKMATSPKNSMH